MSLYEHFTSKGPSGFGYGSTAEQVTAGLSLAAVSYTHLTLPTNREV